MSNSKLKLVVSSANPVKIEAVREGFAKMFPELIFEIESVSVVSGVPDQPMSDKETYTGAVNRAQNARLAMPEADYWFGLEGGVDYWQGEMLGFAWVVTIDKSGQLGKARAASWFLPARVAALLEKGMELGDADDQVYGRSNSKQSSGAIGILTNDAMSRKESFVQPVMLSLTSFRNPQYFTA